MKISLGVWAVLGDIVGLVPIYCNEAIITIQGVTKICWVPQFIYKLCSHYAVQ